MALANVCHGCLSVDRIISPIEEHAKLYHLLLLKKLKDKTKTTLMCWECRRILNNIYTFRMKITQAQKLLNNNLSKTHSSLSNLMQLKKIDDYHIIIHEDEKNKTIPLELEIQVKDEKLEENEASLEELKAISVDVKIDNVKEELKDLDDAFDHFDDPEDLKDAFDNVDGKDDLKDILVPIDLLEKKTEIKVQQGSRKRGALKKKYRTIIMDDIADKRSFYDVQVIDQKGLDKWMEDKKKQNSKKTFQCGLCYCGFSLQHLYEHHLAVRHNSKHKYSCDTCGFRFRELRALRVHVSGHYVQFTCKLCARAHRTRNALYVHFGHGPHTRQMECIKCGIRFDCNKARDFFAHYRSMHGLKVCDHCGMRCAKKSKLAQHIKSRHSQIRCQLCNAEFKSTSALKKHNDRKHVVDTSERNYCVECDIQFANHVLYHDHITRSVKHSTKPRVPCPECDRTYTKRCYMMNHYNKEHLNESKFICTICDRSFLTGFALRCHRKYTHEKLPKPKNHICSYCGRGFNTRRILENHVRTHTGERPFACEHCSAAFAQVTALKTHMRSAHK